MAQVRPMLGDIELQQVQKIEVDGDQVLVAHGVPALEGDFLQRLDRRAMQITITGVLTGPEAGEGLKALRDKFRAAEPVPFVADIATATRVDEVLIEEMGVRELAGKPERFEYAFTLREYIPAPAVTRETPPEPEVPDPQDDEIDENVGTLIVEVEVEGEQDFDFSKISVTVQGTQQDGTDLSRTLTNRTDNVWTEEEFPASQGEYTVQALETNPVLRSGSTSAEGRAGETTRVRITLRSGVIIARSFVVHFRFDKSFIEPCMRAVMRQVIQYANDHRNERLVIVGHTDKVGDDPPDPPDPPFYNQSLSERRARSAFAFLTFGHDPQAALDEWTHLRQRRTPGQKLSINDTWGAYEYQYMLQDLGIYRGNIDGRHGRQTDDAIEAFCCRAGLPPRRTMDDPTWQALIRTYLEQDNLQFPLDRFLPNCPEEILKWIGCGEESPLTRYGTPPRATAWRPYRRVEFLFVSAETLPNTCQVPQPDTFNLPQEGAVANGWCVGPARSGQPHCCFITYDEPTGPDRSSRWWVQPAEPGRITAQGMIRFEGFLPQTNIEFRYVLIAPDGEFVDGEVPRGDLRGEPQARSVSGRTDGDGVFEHAFSYADKPEGIYTLEIRGDFVVRRAGEPSRAATGNIVCKRLNNGDPNFSVVVIARPPLVTNPTITLASSIVVVKKSYTNPARQRVTLRLDYPFCQGDGTFTRSSDIIRFFDAPAGGTEIRFVGGDNVFSGHQLSVGVELYAEGFRPSAAMNDVLLTLTVIPSPASLGPPVGPAAVVAMTAVELTLEIFGPRPAPGVTPFPLSNANKINPGRFVRAQSTEQPADRAMLIIRQAQPADFAGDLILRSSNAQVRAFRETDEIPAPGQTPLPDRHPIPNVSIPIGGLQFWAEGVSVSHSARDTGFQLGIRDLEDDGDRVVMTVIVLIITNNAPPFNTLVSRAQIEGILNAHRSSFDIGDLTANQASSLFRVRAEIPGITGSSIRARLSAIGPDTSLIDTKTFMLGTDNLSHPILAIPSAIPSVEVTFAAPQNIEIIRARAGGRLQLQLEGDFAQVGFIRINVRGRVIYLFAQALANAASGTSSGTVLQDLRRKIARANRIWAQAGIEVKTRRASAPVEAPAELLDVEHTDNTGINLTDEEQRLVGRIVRAGDPTRSTVPTDLNIFYVRSLDKPPAPAADPSGIAFPNDPVIILEGPTTADEALSHEIGHQIIDWSGHDEHQDLMRNEWPSTNVLHRFDTGGSDVDRSQANDIESSTIAGTNIFVIFEP